MVILIFDIDGVLIDDRYSYYLAVQKTVSFCIQHFFKGHIDPSLINHQTIRSLKKFGGFNNDFDVSAALLCYYSSLLDEQLTPIKKWDFCSFLKKISDQSLSGFEGILDATGGKNKECLRFFLHENNTQKDFDENLLIRIFQEIYLGKTLFKKKYGQEPRFCDEQGALYNEKSLISSDCLQSLAHHCDAFAVATGRQREETLYCLEEYFHDVSFDILVTASDVSSKRQKPHPESLYKINTHFSKKGREVVYFFVGDQMDDMRMVFSAQKKMNVIPVAFCRKDGTFSQQEFEVQGVNHIITQHGDIESILKNKEHFRG